MKAWEEVRAWRRSVRVDLLARRAAMLSTERKRADSMLVDLLCERFAELRHGCIGFYWPFKGEPDLRPLIEDLLALGVEAALPVALERRQPLEFRMWHPGAKLERGEWNIPIPAERNIVHPTVLIVPLLGFDAAGYRLGYGGGHYDRTLAAMVPKPFTIGVGYAFGRLETIYPQPHDVPLGAIVTETGSVRHGYRGRPLEELNPSGEAGAAGQETQCRADGKMDGRPMRVFPERDLYEESEEERASYASPPCFMHELDPSYLGYADAAETIAMLNDLLARGLGSGGRDAAAKAALIGGGEDEVSFQAVLRQHILRLGGRPASSASSLPKTADARCDRDRGAVLHKLREILPRIGDGWLHDDLRAMIETLDRQLRRHEESA
jgi:5-formyltetrahydrofolate cyclo-ligase